MKELFLLSIAILIGTAPIWAQTFAEWFKQKKTQIRYLQEQIAALEVYKGIVEKGYTIARDGTKVVAAIKQGDLDMHTDHFKSYGYVNPNLLKVFPIKSAMEFSAWTRETAGEIRIMTEQRKSDLHDWSALGAAYAESVTADCNTKEGLLVTLLTDSQLKMTDDERGAAIYSIWEYLRERWEMAAGHKMNFDAILKSEGL